uniref:Uncharacterized protein n=1 Tax=Rhizophora mucronata TaxID=61149 RepID=A0A2P2PHU0_RHIMU
MLFYPTKLSYSCPKPLNNRYGHLKVISLTKTFLRFIS